MGMDDRDWWRDAQKEREKRGNNSAASGSAIRNPPSTILKTLRWGTFGIVVFWTCLMSLLYVAMKHYMNPKPVVVTASGEWIIPRARDGHFYALGSVNGKPANFLVDTGASLVTVSEKFALEAGLSQGLPAVFSTANGDMPGRIVSDVPVSMGPINVSAVRIAVGFVGHETDDALLGQSFLSKFEVILQKDQMTLRQR
jgi:aspartyl protease family protein